MFRKLVYLWKGARRILNAGLEPRKDSGLEEVNTCCGYDTVDLGSEFFSVQCHSRQKLNDRWALPRELHSERLLHWDQAQGAS